MANIVSAFAIGQNFAEDTVTRAATNALAICTGFTGTPCTAFDLAMLDKPHAIEHDNSLSREDFNYGAGNNHDFSPRVWGQVLRIWAGAPILDFKLAKAALEERVAVTSATDAPGWYVNATSEAYGEIAFWMSLFGDPVAGNARQDWVNVWFEQERMPFELGWTVTQRQTTTSATLAGLNDLLMAA